MQADELIEAVERHTGRPGKRVGKNTRLLCPAHDDHDPSLDIAAAADGTALVRCRSRGCGYDEIVAAVGLTDWNQNGGAEWTPAGAALAVYGYHDEGGVLLYEVCRTESKEFPQRRPDLGAQSGWRWSLEGVRRVLYRLPELIAAVSRSETIYIVEGEKDVDRLYRLGVAATCNPGGAGKWRGEYAATLTGAHVIIVADRDAPGTKHAQQVAESLRPVASTVELRQPVPDHAGADVSDHLKAGHTLEQLEELAEDAAPAIVFEPLRRFLERAVKQSASLVGVARGGTNLLPQYGWVLPWGREGSGKTSVLLDLLFHIAAGKDWLHYPVDRAVKVVMIINEGVPGGLQDKLKQKIELWDGDRDLIQDNLAIYASPWGSFTFRDRAMVDHARDYALGMEADYVALDPLHTLGSIGAGSPQDTEAFKNELRAFGLWDDLGVITSHHSNKAGMISGDWARHADTVIHLEKDGKNAATKITLEKARPADPNELGVPAMLDWVVETMGYTRRELGADLEKVSDAEILERIVTHLRGASSVVSMGDLQADVTGGKERIGKVAKRALADGLLVNISQHGGRFAFRLPDALGDDVQQDAEGAQTRMNTDIYPPIDPMGDKEPANGPPVGRLLPPPPPLSGREGGVEIGDKTMNDEDLF